MATAKLSVLIKENDYSEDILSYHTGGLNKSKIDTAIEANGYTIPLPHKITFHLYKMNGTTPTDVWLCTWHPMMGAYSVEKLTIKS